jgi:hypothetical protein
MLNLKNKWSTQIPWFCLATMLIGVVVTDMLLLCNYHKVINGVNSEQQEKKIPFSTLLVF